MRRFVSDLSSLTLRPDTALATASLSRAGLVTPLAAGAGNDSLTGTAGNDTLDGLAGADTLVGLAGNDTYVVDNVGDLTVEVAGGGVDTVQASLNWTLAAEVENLVLTGTAHLTGTGNGGNNSITGNSGNNTLNGGAGIDTLSGGAGNDVYIVDNSADLIVEAASAGVDAVQSSAASYALGANVENLTLTGSAGLWGKGNAAANSLVGNSGANLLDGADGNDTLAGNLGDDFLFGGNGNDSLVGGEGNDVLGNDAWALDGDVFAPINWQVPYDDEPGNDTLLGGLGNDTLASGAGTDSVDAGDGNDLVVEYGVATETLAGGAGADTLRLDMDGTPTAINFSFVAGANQVVAGRTISGFENVFLWGSSKADTLIGGANDDSLAGGYGRDSLNGGAGNDMLGDDDGSFTADTLTGGAGTDGLYLLWDDETAGVNFSFNQAAPQTVLGNVYAEFEFLFASLGTGNDTVVGSALNDRIDGGEGNDSLSGGAGNDYLTIEENGQGAQGAGNDTLRGGDGDDTLVGGWGKDVLGGGAGADLFVLANMAGYDLSQGGPVWMADGDRTVDFVTGTDHLQIGAQRQYGAQHSNIVVGNGDTVIDGGVTVAGHGGFASASELVIVTTNLRHDLSASTAAAMIGSATGAYLPGQSAVFVVDNGSSSAVYYFLSNGSDALVSAEELTLLATLQGSGGTVLGDYVFG